jgi:hypothetical protein
VHHRESKSYKGKDGNQGFQKVSARKNCCPSVALFCH